MSSSSKIVGGAWAAASRQIKEKSAKMSSTMSRPPRNTFELFGMVLSAARRQPSAQATTSTAAGSGAKPTGAGAVKWRIVIKLGSLEGNPDSKLVTVDNREVRVREFAVGKATNMNEDKSGTELAETKTIEAYSTLDFTVDEKEIIEACGTLEQGDWVRLMGITFSYWYSKNVGKPLLLCNVDKISLVPGATRGGLSYNLWQGMRAPIMRTDSDFGASTAGGSDEAHDDAGGKSFEVRLGKSYYEANYFGTDEEAADRYVTRESGAIIQPEFTECVNVGDNGNKVTITTYTPDVFNKAAGNGFIVQNGFKTFGRVSQWFAGTLPAAIERDEAFITQLFFRLAGEHIAPIGINSQSDWKEMGPKIMQWFKYTFLVRENLEKTEGETFNKMDDEEERAEQGVNFKLAGSAQAFMVNMAAEIKRTGIRLPADRVAEMMGAKPQVKGGDIVLASAIDGDQYHTKRGRDLVIPLNEAKGLNLTELIKKDMYDFYVLTNVEFDDDSRKALAKEPVDKHFLLFDRAFNDEVNASKALTAKAALCTKYGLDENQEFLSLLPLAKQARVRIFYAVLKPEIIVRDYVRHALFVEAVMHCVPNGKVFLDALEASVLGKQQQQQSAADHMEGVEPNVPDDADSAAAGSKKRKAEDAEPDAASPERRGKRAKKHAEEASDADDLAAQLGVSSPKEKKSKKKGHH